MKQRQIEEFEIQDTAGVGTVGTIYHARDLVNECDVALKILLPSVSKEELVVARFEREMFILARLEHPNIVRYYGGGRSGEQLFFAMELLRGGSLKDELARTGPFKPLEGVTCGIQICAALQHAHNHGVIHRDLKPSNLLFDTSGNLKIVDFGIARDTHAADITASGLTVGSWAYMSPEQITGDRLITGQTDLYALGCVLYEILTGRPPFAGDNFAQLFEQHLRSTPAPPQSIEPEVPDGLDELILQLLEKSPENRPFNARSVQASLLELIDQRLVGEEFDKDVPAGDVVDQGRQAIVDRMQSDPHQISWLALAGVLLLVVGLVSAAVIFGT